MYTMSQINHIKDMSSCGYRISEISKETGADPKTIRKYCLRCPMIHSEAARSRVVPRVLRSRVSHRRRLRSSPDHRQIDQIRQDKKSHLDCIFQNSMHEKTLVTLSPVKRI